MILFLRLFIVPLIVIMGLSGCASKKERNIEKIKETIVLYDKLLAEGFSKRDITLLKEVATGSHIGRIEHRMNALHGANRRMDSNLKSIEFLEIEFLSVTSAKAQTRELWDIHHIDVKTQETIKELKDFEYKLNYNLMFRNDKWMIVSVDVWEGGDKPEE